LAGVSTVEVWIVAGVSARKLATDAYE